MAEKTVVVEREAEVREEGLAEEERAAAAAGGVEGVAAEKTVAGGAAAELVVAGGEAGARADGSVGVGEAVAMVRAKAATEELGRVGTGGAAVAEAVTKRGKGSAAGRRAAGKGMAMGGTAEERAAAVSLVEEATAVERGARAREAPRPRHSHHYYRR